MTIYDLATIIVLAMSALSFCVAWINNGRAQREMERIDSARLGMNQNEISRLIRSREGYLIARNRILVVAWGTLAIGLYRLFNG